MNFKRSTAAAALLMATAFPAFAHVPEEVVLQVEGTETFYRVPISVAAEICEIDEQTLTELTMNADVIYCEIAEQIVVDRDFEGQGYELLTDFSGDDDSDRVAPEGVESDGETANEADDNTGTETDVEGDANTGTDAEGDLDVGTGTDLEGNVDTGTDAEGEAGVGSGTDLGGDASVDSGADVNSDIDTNVGSESGADASANADAGAGADADDTE